MEERRKKREDGRDKREKKKRWKATCTDFFVFL
jgi:hypothetical protein